MLSGPGAHAPRRPGAAVDGPTTLSVSRRLLPRPSVSGSLAPLGEMGTAWVGSSRQATHAQEVHSAERTFRDASRLVGHSGTAYVLRVGLFGAATAGELRSQLRRLRQEATAPPRALVIDLRDNDGGLLTAAVSSARMLLPPGSHLLSLQKHAPPRTLRSFRRRWYHRSALPSPLRARDAPPIVVLVNDRTASAAEVFRLLRSPGRPYPSASPSISSAAHQVLAAALRHSGRAMLVGGRTFGKGMSQALVYQRDGAALLFTVYQLACGAYAAATAQPP